MPNKAQFIELLAERLDGDRKRAAAALEAVIDTVYANVAKGERVALTGFGIFEKRIRAARTARNPATGAAVKVKKTAVPAFRAGAEFKAITSGARKVPKAPAAKKARSCQGSGEEGRRQGSRQEGRCCQGSGQEGGHQGSRPQDRCEEGSRQARSTVAHSTQDQGPAPRSVRTERRGALALCPVGLVQPTASS